MNIGWFFAFMAPFEHRASTSVIRSVLLADPPLRAALVTPTGIEPVFQP